MTKQLNSEIIAVGTELLLGQIANTNAKWISEQLAQIGVNVHYHAVVGDNLKRVHDQFADAAKRSDLIIVTGGLGPTDDDLTREAFQNLTNLNLNEHKPSMDRIKAFFNKQKMQMTPNNHKQARVFQGAEVIDNTVGMAPGMILHHDDAIWVFVPGVPKEMKAMMSECIIPTILQEIGEQTVIRSTMLRFVGIGESQLEHELKSIIDRQTNPTIAPLAQPPGVSIRLTAKATNATEAHHLIQTTKQEILQKVGAYCYGADDDTLESITFDRLKEKGLTLAAAESLTGGQFSEQFVALEGASHVFQGGIVCYSADVKENVLNVSKQTIEQKGTVSESCAREMAENIREKMNASIGISFTGVAGPDSIEGQEVGTVYIGLSQLNTDCRIEKFTFSGNRQSIRNKAVTKGYQILFDQVNA